MFYNRIFNTNEDELKVIVMKKLLCTLIGGMISVTGSLSQAGEIASENIALENADFSSPAISIHGYNDHGSLAATWGDKPGELVMGNQYSPMPTGPEVVAYYNGGGAGPKGGIWQITGETIAMTVDYTFSINAALRDGGSCKLYLYAVDVSDNWTLFAEQEVFKAAILGTNPNANTPISVTDALVASESALVGQKLAVGAQAFDDIGQFFVDKASAEVIGMVQTLTMIVEPLEAGSDAASPAMGETQCFYGETVQLEATSSFTKGSFLYTFDHWLGDVADPNASPTAIIMDNDKTVTAVFLRQCQGEGSPYYMSADISGPQNVPDCYIDIYDFALLGEQWLESGVALAADITGVANIPDNSVTILDLAEIAGQWRFCTDISNANCDAYLDKLPWTRIVVPNDSPALLLHAAQELKSFLNQMSGQELLVVTDQSPMQSGEIILGNNEHIEGLTSIDYQALGAEGFTIRTVDSHLAIAANNDGRGVLNGVYTFLEEHLGCRWYSPTVSYIPTWDTVLLDVIDRTDIPVIEWREVYYYEAMDTDWAARLKLNGNESAWSFTQEHETGSRGTESHRDWGTWVHSFYSYLSPSEYFDTHPEYFSEIDGVRRYEYNGQPGQLCLSNPDVLNICINKLGQWIAANPEIHYWDCSQMDSMLYCHCSECLAIDDPEGTPMASILTFVNNLASAYPNTTVSTLSYNYSIAPPTNIVPAENVLIKFCANGARQGDPYVTSTHPVNVTFRNNLQSWAAVSNNMFIWDYVVNYNHIALPFPNLRVQKPNLQFFVNNNVKGLFSQGTRERGGEFSELRTYLLAKLMWNPNADDDAIIDDFLTGYYGQAAPFIRDYIDLMHNTLDSSGLDLYVYDYSNAHVNGYLSHSMIDQYKSLFDQAEQAVAGDPDLAERVEAARLPLMYAQLEVGYGSVADRCQIADRFFQVARENVGLWMIHEVNLNLDQYESKVYQQYLGNQCGQ